MEQFMSLVSIMALILSLLFGIGALYEAAEVKNYKSAIFGATMTCAFAIMFSGASVALAILK